jgi:hypothetical protein
MSYLSEKEFYKRGYQRGYNGKKPGKLFEFPDEKEEAARDRGYEAGKKDRQLDDEKKARTAAARGQQA